MDHWKNIPRAFPPELVPIAEAELNNTKKNDDEVNANNSAGQISLQRPKPDVSRKQASHQVCRCLSQPIRYTRCNVVKGETSRMLRELNLDSGPIQNSGYSTGLLIDLTGYKHTSCPFGSKVAFTRYIESVTESSIYSTLQDLKFQVNGTDLELDELRGSFSCVDSPSPFSWSVKYFAFGLS
jgi:hypothetical protein